MKTTQLCIRLRMKYREREKVTYAKLSSTYILSNQRTCISDIVDSPGSVISAAPLFTAQFEGEVQRTLLLRRLILSQSSLHTPPNRHFVRTSCGQTQVDVTGLWYIDVIRPWTARLQMFFFSVVNCNVF